MAFLAKYAAGAIGDVMQTVDVNTEWKDELKDKMPEVATACIDAICAFLSNDNMQSCEDNTDDDTKTGFKPPTYMATEVQTILKDYISGNTSDLLYYVPESIFPTGIQGGGSMITSIAGNALQNIPTVKAAGMGFSAAKLGANAASGAANLGANAASGAANIGANAASGAANLGANAASDMTGLASDASNLPMQPTSVMNVKSIPGMPTMPSGDSISLKQNEIENGKAKTILKKFKSDLVSKFKCDEHTTNYIKDKIIDTMLRAIRNKLIDENINKKNDVKQLLSSIAKETTTQSINNQISLIKPIIETYQNIINTTPVQILPNYLRLMLELFVYSEYNDLLSDEKLQLNTFDLSTHIAILMKVDGFNDVMIKLDDNSVAGIMDLNKLPSPNTDDGDTEKASQTTNNQVAFEKFKQLFEEKPVEEKAGGGRRKTTRKKRRHHKKHRSTRRYR